MKISIQNPDFSLQDEYDQLKNRSRSQGAVVTFVGLVRDMIQDESNKNQKSIVALELEHYPNMTEKYLHKIVTEANKRWEIGAATIIHRIGKILLDEQIVFVGITSSHRQQAFEACWFLMDKLKTEAPFWKKEIVQIDGQIQEHWVEAKLTDQDAMKKWH